MPLIGWAADKLWEVEAAVGVRMYDGELEYLIAWLGWGKAHWSWEPMRCLDKTEANELMLQRLWGHLSERYNVASDTYNGKKELRATEAFYVEQSNWYFRNVTLPGRQVSIQRLYNTA
ncbi:hypothetical protein BDZ89DRAFT_1144909 [Hymenopellis radicata]|nr:hypothetical protein BDZ89DRAFT_1144909 [Hymenopellis radicata]